MKLLRKADNLKMLSTIAFLSIFTKSRPFKS